MASSIENALELWRGLLRVPWRARRSNQSILKEIKPEYSLEGLMLKLQYFGHLMQRVNSLEKTLMLRKIEGRRRGQQRMRWLDGITGSMDMKVKVLVTQSCPTLCDSRTSPPLSMGFSRQTYWTGVMLPFFRGSSQLRYQTQVSHIIDSFFFNHLSHQGCPVIDMSLSKFLEIVKDTED